MIQQAELDDETEGVTDRTFPSPSPMPKDKRSVVYGIVQDFNMGCVQEIQKQAISIGCHMMTFETR